MSTGLTEGVGRDQVLQTSEAQGCGGRTFPFPGAPESGAGIVGGRRAWGSQAGQRVDMEKGTQWVLGSRRAWSLAEVSPELRRKQLLE